MLGDRAARCKFVPLSASYCDAIGNAVGDGTSAGIHFIYPPLAGGFDRSLGNGS